MLHWQAYYDNGVQINQSLGGSYASLDRKHLVAFDILLDNTLLIRFDLRSKAKEFLWRRRTALHSDGEKESYFLVGYPGSLMAVFENGIILHFGDWNDVFGPVDPFPWEKSDEI